MLIKFISEYLYNGKKEIEVQRLNCTWMFKNGHLDIWNEFKTILCDKEQLFKIIIDNDLGKKHNINNTTCICEGCGKKTRFISMAKGYNKYCSKHCAGTYTVNSEKVSETKFIKYGDRNYNNSAKAKQTNKTSDNRKRATELKKKKTLEKYGVFSMLSLPEVRAKITETKRINNSYTKMVESIKLTNLDRYGVEWNSQISEVKRSKAEKSLLKYGYTCPLQNENIKAISITTNMSKYNNATFAGSLKWFEAMYETDMNGQNAFDRIHTKKQTLGEDGLDSYERGYRKKKKILEEQGVWLSDDKVSDFRKYSRLVRRLTNKQDISNLSNAELRGVNTFHLDHKLSIYDGFINNMPTFVISAVVNLVMLPRKVNQCKGRNSSITKDELLKLYYNS